MRLLTIGVLSGIAYYVYDSVTRVAKAPSPPPNVVIPKAEMEFETKASSGSSSSSHDSHEDISPQHRQIKRSLANPGVYAWGSNAGGVVAPDLPDESMVKQPRRIAAFDGQLLRDLRLDRDMGVAVTEKGDVVQWGVGFDGGRKEGSADENNNQEWAPTPTLAGKNIVRVALSQDRVLALSSDGTVYSLPASQADQLQTAAISQTSAGQAVSSSSSASSSWRNFLWSSASSSPGKVNYRLMTPRGLAWGERVVDVRSGLEHCLLLTSKGRVFAAAASFESFPARGQLGIPGLTWTTRKAMVTGPLDEPHLVGGSLQGVAAAQIAAGDRHSLVLARDGRVFVFGDNASGQLGLPVLPEASFVDEPVELPVQALYSPEKGSPGSTKNALAAALARNRSAAARKSPPRVTAIAAGGANSFITVDVPPERSDASASAASASASASTTMTTSDTWACGNGLYGSLGTGKWMHISGAGPTRVPALSGLSEYNETAGRIVPIRPVSVAVGATHASAVLGNATNVSMATSSGGSTEPSWGSEVLWWGGNEFYQLGTGRRNNVCEPIHIGSLQSGGEEAEISGDKKKKRSSKAATASAAAAAVQAMTGERERLELVPRATVQLGQGSKSRKVSTEQRVVCGRHVSGVYFST